MPALPPKPRQQSPAVVSSFQVATSTSPRSQSSDQAHLNSFQASSIARALSHAGPSSLALKLDWIERLSGPETPLQVMKEATKILDGPAYDDLLVERHMEGLCPYAVCGSAAATPYKSEEEQAADAKRIKVRMMANGLFEAPGGQGKSAYCSVRCKARSEWYRGILGRDGEGEMLEDVEERRKDVARSTREILEEAAKEQEAGVVKSASESTAEATPPPSSKAASFANDLLSSLSIREKPTSAVPPSAPTLDSAKYDFERPSAASASSATRFPSSPAPRAGSSTSLPSSGAALLPFNTASLTRTVLRATSAQPVPPSRQPTRGVNGLPPIRFASNPRMLDGQGREVEWVGVDEEGETEEVREMMEEALMIKRMVEKGEL